MKNICGPWFFLAGFGSSSQHMQRTVDCYPYGEFIPKSINLCYTPFQAIVELFDNTTKVSLYSFGTNYPTLLFSPSLWWTSLTSFSEAILLHGQNTFIPVFYKTWI